jgi:hypothetical protein
VPEWISGPWGKFLAFIATSIVSGAVAAGTTAVHFYYETKQQIAVLKEQMTEVQNRLELRVAANERKSLKHEVQIASVVRKQDQIFGKEAPVGDAMPQFSPVSPPAPSKGPQ